MFKKILSLALASMMCISVPFAVSAAENEGAEILYSQDFETAEIGTGADKFGLTSSNVGLYATVEEKDGNKAIKMTSEATNDATFSETNIPKLKYPSGAAIEISYDVFIESRTRCFQHFAAITAGSVFGSNTSYADTFYFHNSWTGFSSIKDNAWAKIKYVVNTNTGELTYYVNNSAAWSKKGGVKAPDSLNLVVTAISNSLGCPNYKTGNPPLVMWFDNFEVKIQRVAVKSTNISDGKIVPTVGLRITFEDAIKSFDTEKIKLYKSGMLIEEPEISSQGSVLVVSGNNFDFGCDYKIELAEGAVIPNSAKSASKAYTFEFSTISLIKTKNIEDGEAYMPPYTPEIEETGGITYTAQLEFEGEVKEFTLGDTLEELGNYVITITAENADGKSETKAYKIRIVGQEAPVAKNVKITGKVETGETLIGEWTYRDYNNDPEGEHSFRWFKSETADGEPQEISGATSDTYVLTEDDENYYIFFEVTPKSTVEPCDGEPTLSAAIAGPFAPTAEVSSELITEDMIQGKYTCSDVNGDDLETPEIRWYYCDEDGENRELIDGANQITYRLDENDINAYIVLGITPKSTKSPTTGEEAFSAPHLLPYAPTATDVKTLGKAKVGQTLAASYLFEDKNADEEGDSEIKWYVGGNMHSKGKSLTLTSDMQGKTVYFEVTPISKEYPYEGDKIKSNVVSVAKTSTSSSGGGSGSVGGGGKTNSSAVSPVVKPSTSVPKEDVKPQTGLQDIKSHWAEKEITSLYEKKIVNGSGNNEFNPDGNITRAEAAAMIQRAFGYTGGKAEYADVPEDAWYNESVAALAENKIMNGSNGFFRPESNITREELCVALYNVAEQKGLLGEVSETKYDDDSEISDWAKDKVYAISGTGFVNGVGENKFAPKENATRAQFAAILYRMIEKLN